MLQSPVGILREDRARPALRDRAGAFPRELGRRIDHDEIVGVEAPADVVDADRDAGGLAGKVVERRAAAAHQDGLAAVPAREAREGVGRQGEPGTDASGHQRFGRPGDAQR